MGNSSSQPTHGSSQSPLAPTTASPVAKRRPHYSPSMDDFAASQQLLDEQEHAQLTGSDGLYEKTPSQLVNGSVGRESKKRKRTIARKPTNKPSTTSTMTTRSASSPKRTVPLSQSIPRSDLEANTSTNETPATSSSYIHTKDRRTSGRRVATNRQLQGRGIDRDGDTVMDMEEMVSPSQRRLKTRAFSGTPASNKSQKTLKSKWAKKVWESPHSSNEEEFGALDERSTRLERRLQRLNKFGSREPFTKGAKGTGPDTEPRTSHAERLVSPRKLSSSEKRRRSLDMYDWAAPVRTLGMPFGESFNFEDDEDDDEDIAQDQDHANDERAEQNEDDTDVGGLEQGDTDVNSEEVREDGGDVDDKEVGQVENHAVSDVEKDEGYADGDDSEQGENEIYDEGVERNGSVQDDEHHEVDQEDGEDSHVENADLYEDNSKEAGDNEVANHEVAEESLSGSSEGPHDGAESSSGDDAIPPTRPSKYQATPKETEKGPAKKKVSQTETTERPRKVSTKPPAKAPKETPRKAPTISLTKTPAEAPAPATTQTPSKASAEPAAKIAPKMTPLRSVPAESPFKRSIRKSVVDPANSTTSADKALNTVRNLNHPLQLRNSGDLTSDEQELIRRAIKDYQERKNLSTSELVDIIQWTLNDRENSAIRQENDWTPQDKEDMQESNEFWGELQAIDLTRNFKKVKRHIRSRYHTFKKGGWTEEEDDLLRKLQAAHPAQWKLISTHMGDRSRDDCRCRWNDYLQYGDKRQVSDWSKEEEARLMQAVDTVIQRDIDRRAEAEEPQLARYESKDIYWTQVSKEMGGIRSRLQVSVKWALLNGRGEQRPDQDAVVYSTPKKTVRSRKTKKERSQPKTVPNTPLPRQILNTPNAKSPGISRMLWGDKFDLIEVIVERYDEREEDVDWHAVVAQQKHVWSARTLQAALREMQSTALEQGYDDGKGGFQHRVYAVLEFLAREHADELKEHYDPYCDAGSDSDIETVDPTSGPRAKTKKRRAEGNDASPETRVAKKKKKKKKKT